MSLPSTERVNHIRALAGHPGFSAPQLLEALKQLKVEPRSYEQGLILALKYPDQEIQAVALTRSLQHLQDLAHTSPADLAAFFELLLEFCFLYSNQANFATTRMKLIEEIALWLQESHRSDLKLDHLTARLVTRSRFLRYQTRVDERFAAAVLGLVSQFARGERSDQLTLSQLEARRKTDTFASNGAPIGTIRGYLRRDQDISVSTLAQADFVNYALLLHNQNHPSRASLVLHAVQNLHTWLQALQATLPTEDKPEAQQTLRQIQQGVWESLPHPLLLYLEVYLQLLPGGDKSPDLFYLLRWRYRFPDNKTESDIVRLILAMLEMLPGYRYRLAKEMLPFLAEQLRPGRWSWELQQAALHLIGVLATGISEIEEAGPPADDNSPEGREKRRQWERLQRRRTLLSRNIDQPARRFLEAVSDDTKYAENVREAAWQTLLGLGLHQDEQQALFQRGLSELTATRFLTTLRLAGETHYRDIWRWLESKWNILIAPDAPPQTRRDRLALVMDVLSRLRIPEAFVATESTVSPGPLVALALDDPDPQIKILAARAIERGGFSATLQMEKSRRSLLQLQQVLEETTRQANLLQEQQRQLQRQLAEAHAESERLEIGMQACNQRLNIVVSETQLLTVEIQTKMLEIQQRLERAVAKAAIEQSKLRELADQVKRNVEGLRAAQTATASLANQRAEAVQKVGNQQSTIDSLEAQRQSLGRELQSLKAEERRLRSAIGQSQSVEQANKLNNKLANCQNSLTIKEQALADLPKEIEAARSSLQALQDNVSHIEHKIEQHGRDARQLNEATVRYRRQYEAGEAVWRELISYIQRLEGENQQHAREQQEKEKESQAKINRLNREQQELHNKHTAVSTRLRKMGEEAATCQRQLQAKLIEQQRLVSEMDSLFVLMEQQRAAALEESVYAPALAQEQAEEYRLTRTLKQTQQLFVGEAITEGVKKQAITIREGAAR